ncbi:hypothetical protein [Nocardiopsis changdeensis]|uniref:Uncharacterized protein n=2 Tax=Nocardiopsidaceae TaxID=83676 RepID=A0ABX8BEA5_9ACTN|nr:hypothetical protein [Nocardiopsis changdeensis]QUX20584.1 hypothetical protein KGD84_18945 [Nocardiopsis changdeensis]
MDDAAHAHRLIDALDEDNERLIEARLPSDPQAVHLRNLEEHLNSARSDTALTHMHAVEGQARAHAVWWADAASQAVLALDGYAPDYRLLATDPATILREEQLELLSGPEDAERAQLRATGGWTASLNGAGAILDSARAASLGLRLIHAPQGQNTTVEPDWTLKARYHVLWGRMWREHNLPLLPEPDLLACRLQGALDEDQLQAVRTAMDTWSQMAQSIQQLPELTQRDLHGIGTPEERHAVGEQLEKAQEDRLQSTEVLAAYARALTEAWKTAVGVSAHKH